MTILLLILGIVGAACISNLYTMTMAKEEIEVPSYLDAKEERKKALEKIRDIIFHLTIDYVGEMEDDHPAHIREAREKANRIWEEICRRKQDYDAFMYDYKQDWDLNYNDYGKIL